MKKIKPLMVRQGAAIRRRINNGDDGVMAIPTPPEERVQSHEEMQNFIIRFREKESNKQTEK
ncbi:hypothetical protein AB4Z29_25200 [Paenibacillus sp. 2TAB23]|uniref:hypothetical protein n=1 Tax=Paenibacillus sp. 2TAB23 TaxID=3233004 RepID=UPI003F968016